MPKSYNRDFKKMCVELIVFHNHSTIKTADEFSIPLKTLEKWITSYNKDKHCFDADYLTSAKQIDFLKRKVNELEKSNDILKKTITMLAKKD